MQNLRKLPVHHVLWGEGQIIRQYENVITVRFPAQGDKEFLYPDVFDRFLTMDDPGQRQIISYELAQKKAAEEAKRREETQLREEEARRRAEEKALLAAAKRKARPRAAAKKAPTAKATHKRKEETVE